MPKKPKYTKNPNPVKYTVGDSRETTTLDAIESQKKVVADSFESKLVGKEIENAMTHYTKSQYRTKVLTLKRESLHIVEKYRVFFEYIYNPILTANKRHLIFKEHLLNLLLNQFNVLHIGVKSTSKSRLYEADANLATIRSLLKVALHSTPDRKILSPKQVEHAFLLLSNVGSILNSMIQSVNK